jgi:hypothetical protein
MTDGIYSITFRGAADWGMGVLIFKSGVITGADVGGAVYDGTYTDSDDTILVDVVMHVPAGVDLVQGTPASPAPYTVRFNAQISKSSMRNGDPVLIVLPPGPVNVIFKLLRPL